MVVVPVGVENRVDVRHLQAEPLQGRSEVLGRGAGHPGVDQRQLAAPQDVEHDHAAADERIELAIVEEHVHAAAGLVRVVAADHAAARLRIVWRADPG